MTASLAVPAHNDMKRGAVVRVLFDGITWRSAVIWGKDSAASKEDRIPIQRNP